MAIPSSKEMFDGMGFMSQLDVKDRLLQRIFNQVYDRLRTFIPLTLHHFTCVLSENKMEEIRESKDVIMGLLIHFQCMMRKKPSWFEILEKIFKEQGCWDLYYAMNPWEERARHRGAARGEGTKTIPGSFDRFGGNEKVSSKSQQQRNSSKTDTPASPHESPCPRAKTRNESPSREQDASPFIQASQRELLNASPQDATSTAQPSSLQVYQYFHIQKVSKLLFIQESKAVSEHVSARTAEAGGPQECTTTSHSYYHPDPMNISDHQTHPKQYHNEEQERLPGPEEQEVSDIIDLRQEKHRNHGTGSDPFCSLRNDNNVPSPSTCRTTPADSQLGSISVTLPLETTEAEIPFSAGNIISPNPPQSSDSNSEEPDHAPLQPQPQNDGGVMNRLTRAWSSVKDALLWME